MSMIHNMEQNAEICRVIELALVTLLQLDAAAFQAGALHGWGALLPNCCVELADRHSIA